MLKWQILCYVYFITIKNNRKKYNWKCAFMFLSIKRWIKWAQKFSIRTISKTHLLKIVPTLIKKKKNSRTCTPNNQNLGGPIPKVKNKNLQKPRYTWRCAVDRSVLALLGGEGGEGWRALTSHCPLYPAQPREHRFQQDFRVGPGTASVQGLWWPC